MTLPDRVPKHRCEGDGCSFSIPTDRVMCRHCWAKVPRELQAKVYAHWDYGVRSPAFLAMLLEAIDATRTSGQLVLHKSERDAKPVNLALPCIVSARIDDPLPHYVLREHARLFGLPYVLARCVSGDVRGYVCLGCSVYLANAFQLASHAEAAGQHTIALICADHGAEVLPCSV